MHSNLQLFAKDLTLILMGVEYIIVFIVNIIIIDYYYTNEVLELDCSLNDDVCGCLKTHSLYKMDPYILRDHPGKCYEERRLFLI